MDQTCFLEGFWKLPYSVRYVEEEKMRKGHRVRNIFFDMGMLCRMFFDATIRGSFT